MTFIVEAARQLVRGLVFWSDERVGRIASVEHGGRPLTWRHHGLGMLQAELSETLRVHVWHPSLVSPGMAWPRCVHDHRFDILSAVVVGTVRDVVPDIRFVSGKDLGDLRVSTGLTHPSGQWSHAKIYEIEHAKYQDRIVMTGGGTTATSARYLGDVILTRAYASRDHRAGTSYEIPRRCFHTTEVDGLAVTVVHRSNFDDRLARVLSAPNGDVTAISGIVRDESPEHNQLVESVLRQAAYAIGGLSC